MIPSNPDLENEVLSEVLRFMQDFIDEKDRHNMTSDDPARWCTSFRAKQILSKLEALKKRIDPDPPVQLSN